MRRALALAAMTAALLAAVLFVRPAPVASGGTAMRAVDLTHLSIATSLVASGLDDPIGIVNAGDGSGRLFVVEQGGLIRVLRGGVLQPQPYLNLSSWVETDSQELGLESIAFAPTFATTGRLYVYYTAPGGYDILQRLTLSDPATDTPGIKGRQTLLQVKKSTLIHHGGGMAFGPDGYLYLGTGDGGPQGDPGNHAQNRKLLLGKILRIDPGDHIGKAPYTGTYTIPKSNPYYHNKKHYRQEIWAYGLRNPWRLTFDSANGNLWIGDVGLNRYEEIDFQKAGSKGGQNYGWHVWEGNHRYTTKPKKVSRKGFTFPIQERSHPSFECIIGGYVYRGSAYPALYGTYLYGDWVTGRIGAVKRTSTTGKLLSTPQHALMLQTPFSIASFGTDEAHELYLADRQGGSIYRVTATVK